MERTPSNPAAAAATPGLRAHTPLSDPQRTPALFLPSGPFSGFHHLSYMHHLAMEQDRAMPDLVDPMPPVDAFALVSE